MSDVEYKRNDTVPLEVQLPVDLTTATTVEFHMEHIDDGDGIQKQALFRDKAQGRVAYDFDAEDTDASGVHNMEWQVTWSNGDVETFPRSGYDTIEFVEELG